MLPGRIKSSTRVLGKPARWDESTQGPCSALAIRDAHIDGLGDTMTSAWFPTREELTRLSKGAPLYLRICGVMHPPVALFVGMDPDKEEALGL